MTLTRVICYLLIVIGAPGCAAPAVRRATAWGTWHPPKPTTAYVRWNTTPGNTYRVYYGTRSHVYTSSLDAGSASYRAVYNLRKGTRYYFALTARNSRGESAKSQERTFTP